VKSLNIPILKNGTEVRQTFIKKFTIPWDEFQISHKKWIDYAATQNYKVTYEKLHLWELMDYRAISFTRSLEFLRAMPGEMYLMSENESNPNCRGIRIDGVEYKGGVVKMNAAALADLIEYEWYEPYRLNALGMYLTHPVLPEDIYVFDASMEHLLVFTHENDYWELELEQPMKCAASRFCMMYGFELPEAVTYDQIRAVLAADLAPEDSLEVEISYSCSMYFRQFIVSKWAKEDNTGYLYWFDFDSNTDYATWEAAENAKVFNQLSLKEVSEQNDVRFDIITINGSAP
jgi:hypothetical protein